jgi:DNA ligase-1
MRYRALVEVYEEIEATTKRLEMTDCLAELFSQTPPDAIEKVVYLTQGKLYPDYVGVELGIAEKLALRALLAMAGIGKEEIEELYREKGDLGLVAEVLVEKKRQQTLFRAPLTVETVYDSLDKIARASGPGSLEAKIRALSGLLSNAEPKEAKYILRTVTGKLRLGIADMTLLDALALAFTGEKGNREAIERAYNLTSDLGHLAALLQRRGLEGIREVRVQVGRPIRMMLAQRLASPEEILEKLGGEAACEWKYDGERIQIHKEGEEIQLFSRRLERITDQYPDVRALIRQNLRAEEAIVEGECVALHPETGELLPFQELMHRRRKYHIRKAMKEFPVGLFLFDALYIDGADLTQRPYSERRRFLQEAVKPTDRLRIAETLITRSTEEVVRFFEKALEEGCEGLILKALTGPYQAGSRGWLWIKLKQSYQSRMIEPIDVVVVGAFYGRGRRSGSYGALLAAVYDPERDLFPTLCKVGTGFTDEILEGLLERFEEFWIPTCHPRVSSDFQADVWFIPALLIEIIGDELTLSPSHKCAWGRIREGAGIAVRFPRFTGRWRLDKAPEDATTVEEIVEMYRSQLKRIEGKGERG